MEYTRNELLICQAARQLVNGEVVFVGIGLPNLACNLARHLHAPDLVLIYESGTVGSVPERVPVSIGDPALVSGALSVCPIFDVFYYYLQAGRIDVGFLQGAPNQINTSEDSPRPRGSISAASTAPVASPARPSA